LCASIPGRRLLRRLLTTVLDAAEQRIHALAVAIIRALSPRNGRSNLRDSEEELIQRLDQEGVIYDAADLPAALSRLEAGEVPGQSWKLLRPTAEAAVRVRAMSATSPGA